MLSPAERDAARGLTPNVKTGQVYYGVLQSRIRRKLAVTFEDLKLILNGPMRSEVIGRLNQLQKEAFGVTPEKSGDDFGGDGPPG